MTNNLKVLKKELKSFAKRVKDFKYTDSALITFLLTGMISFTGISFNLYSAQDEIKAQEQAINTSIVQIKKDFRRAREENNKLLRTTNLELIQLMEQGDHVVKSPWSSWQYGMNYVNNNWNGEYKGRGDKVKDVKYTRSTGMDKYQYQRRGQLSYGGSTDITFPIEPNAAIPIAAALKPIQPLAKNANLALNVDLSNLPAFEPTTVVPPVIPTVKAPEPKLNISVSVSGPSRGSGQHTNAFNDNSEAVVENVALKGGKITIDRKGTGSYDYKANNVTVENIRGTAATSSISGFAYGVLIPSHSNSSASASNAFFQVRGGEHAPYGITINGSDIDYKVISGHSNLNELVHQDVHGGSPSADVITAINTATAAGVTNLDSNVINDIVNTVVYETSKSQPNQYNVFANGGTINIAGPKAMLVNSYNHGGGNGVVINGGTVNLNGTDENRAVFLITANTRNTNEPIQYYYNTGDINVNSKNSSIFSFLPETKRNIAIINKGHMNLNNEGTAGIIIDKSVGYHENGHTDGNTAVNLHLNFSKANSDTVGQVLLSSTGYKSDDMPTSANNGLYINKLDGNGIVDKLTAKNNSFPLVISGKKSVGLYTKYDTSTETAPGTNDLTAKTFINGQFAVDIKTNASKAEDGSAGIYSASNIDLQGHYIKVEGSNNVGVYPVKTSEATNSPVYFLGKGSIELTGGNNNTGIVVKHNAPGTNPASGQVYSASEMVLNGGKENIAIYAEGHGSNTYDVMVKSIETGTDTQDNVFIFADNSANVRVGFRTGGSTPTVAGGLKVKANMSANPTYNGTSLDKNVGGVYAKNGAVVDVRQTGYNFGNTTAGEYNVDITGKVAANNPNVYGGFGLFAKDGANIRADYNKIKTTDTGVGVAAVGSSSKIDLTNGEVDYTGSGYALYTEGTSDIILNDGTLTLGGKATGYIKDMSGSNGVQFNNNTKIDVKSDDVILMDLRGVASLNSTGLDNSFTGSGGFLSGAQVTPGSASYKYKYAVMDGTTFNIDSDINKGDNTPTSDGYVFTRRLLLQNSTINVGAGKNVTANLNTADLTSIGGANIPVGIAVAASSKSSASNMTAINNDGNVTVNRTDNGNGGVGLYVNYGKINNNASGKVEVESTNNNPHAVGIYGTNSTPIVNAGEVTVGGEKSFGILGLSYRINNAGARVDPTTEAYYNPTLAAAGQYGKVDVTNTGKITVNKDSSVGIYAYNNSLGIGNNNERGAGDIKATNVAGGTITMNGGNNSIAMGTSRGTLTNAGTINVNGPVSAGMYATDSSTMENTSTGTINVAATTAGSESIGMFTQDINTPITTSGTINVGQNSYGIYGRNVNMNGGAINVGDSGLGIYSTGPNVALNSGTVNVGNNNAVGVYVQDDKNSPTPINITGNVNMAVGNNQSFGYSLITSQPVSLTTGAGTTASVGDKSVYIYSASPIQAGSLITNNSTVNMTGTNGYAIYSLQDAVNNGTINMGSGVGNIGLYSTGGTITNTGTINVGPSNTTTKEFGIGMATGYFDETTGTVSNVGTVVNNGVINVTTPNSIGMYAVGAGSKAINGASGVINLSGANTIGMYIDQGATGINYGNIKTVATGSKMKGVVLANGGILKNYGNIEITGSDTMGVYSDGTGVFTGPYAEDGSGTNNSDKPVYLASATDAKTEGSVTIKTPPKANPQSIMVRKPDGTFEAVKIENVDTNAASPNATVVEVREGDSTILNDPFKTFDLGTISRTKSQTGEITSVAMYVDTSGINFTHPIQGLHYLSGLTDINLIMGVEATEYSNAKAIEVGDNILSPYNQALNGVTGTLNVNSSSLTWLAQPVRNLSGSGIDRVYLVKVPYTDFASKKDPDTRNFLDGLEQRYGVDDYGARGAREKILFNKLNGIGKGETHIFAQAVNEMKGYQYSNTQQRINETGSLLDKEFTYLHDQWRNPSKQNNKIKVFGMRNEYNTDTAGVIDNESNAYGVAYVHEDEDVRMGNSQGWYAGAVNNHYKFKDLGGSRENQTMVKAGLFKTMSPANDHNGSLRWTIAGDVFAGRNEMKRRFWVVDDTFNAKSDYYSYGAALKTDLGYDIRTSERTHVRPYGALKVEYGRFTSIKEDDGEIRLKVDGNDYVSVKPEVGVEFKYVQPLAVRTNLTLGLTAAYTDELGKVNNLNKAKVRYTTADWYNLKNEKEDRRGSGKFDLNLGVDNTRFGVTANLGYDTKGENVRGGLGFRLIY
ncbi:autotransporter-associated N-terminal domain-containing protein [Leptotrichia sp. oral taxon 847]|uniref:autotransporter-associated N-terminal domain-containing protein n=1 Tax=Leptotrichia sp. oral taxon 847 TaxID=1785996 RepID=UPI0007680E85|nr:autotransporter-associated N-terminal domain-containing protein [Leptotrichia sp. oral taxon 847]AMD94326.1 hypothetical protein AXF11_01095 [Leptotrichia sp. oral taxon 847]